MILMKNLQIYLKLQMLGNVTKVCKKTDKK